MLLFGKSAKTLASYLLSSKISLFGWWNVIYLRPLSQPPCPPTHTLYSSSRSPFLIIFLLLINCFGLDPFFLVYNNSLRNRGLFRFIFSIQFIFSVFPLPLTPVNRKYYSLIKCFLPEILVSKPSKDCVYTYSYTIFSITEKRKLTYHILFKPE